MNQISTRDSTSIIEPNVCIVLFEGSWMEFEGLMTPCVYEFYSES